MMTRTARTKRNARCDRRIASNGAAHTARVDVKKFRSGALIAARQEQSGAVARGRDARVHGSIIVARSYLRRVQ